MLEVKNEFLLKIKIYKRLKEKEELQLKAIEGNDLVYVKDDMKSDIEELVKYII